MKLLSGGHPVEGGRVEAGRAEVSFLAGPGAYEATLEDASGAVERVARGGGARQAAIARPERALPGAGAAPLP